jgi:hypothetical protein
MSATKISDDSDEADSEGGVHALSVTCSHLVDQRQRREIGSQRTINNMVASEEEK